jgi:hypothetical protein
VGAVALAAVWSLRAVAAAAELPPGLASPDRGVVSSPVGVDWQWLRTRYNNDTEARPADPSRYRVCLEPDGTLRTQADCNAAGGTYAPPGGPWSGHGSAA